MLERGLEYLRSERHFHHPVFADDSKQIELRRFVDMAAESWFSGDMDIRRPAMSEIEHLMQADDLHVGEVVDSGATKKSTAKGKIADKEKPPDPKEKRKPRRAREPNCLRYEPLLSTFRRQLESVSGSEIIFHRLSTPVKLDGTPASNHPRSSRARSKPRTERRLGSKSPTRPRGTCRRLSP